MDLQFSLYHVMAECIDFKEEKTALQYLGTQLGVSVQLTPKFHAERAGEGIEYVGCMQSRGIVAFQCHKKRSRELQRTCEGMHIIGRWRVLRAIY
jgi:hypothetical protein